MLYLQVLFALEMASVGITQLSSIFTDAANAKGSAASIFEILDRKSSIDPGDDSGITIENLKGEIVFDHVSFSYPTRPNVQIFQDLCLAIPSSKVPSYETIPCK